MGFSGQEYESGLPRPPPGDLLDPGIKPTSTALPALAGRFFTAWASTVAQTVKILPVLWETQIQSLGREDPLKNGMTSYSSILAWKIPWTEESGEAS